MKLVTVEDSSGARYPGVISGDEVIRLDAMDMPSLFEIANTGLDMARAADQQAGDPPAPRV